MTKLFVIFTLAFYSVYTSANEPLTEAPTNLTQTKFLTKNNTKTHMVQLKWKQIPTATTYKIIITRKDKHFRKIYITGKNFFNYNFLVNASYAWKVVARKNGKDFSKFSPYYDITVIHPKSFKPIAENTKINDVAWTKETYQDLSNLPKGPKSRILTKYYENYKADLYPIDLKWDKVPGANLYEIEIIRVSSKRRMFYFSKNNYFPVVLFPNSQYKWRIIAYKNKTRLSNYSNSNPLIVIYGQKGPRNKIIKVKNDNLSKQLRLKRIEKIRDLRLMLAKKRREALIKKAEIYDLYKFKSEIESLKLRLDQQKIIHDMEIERLRNRVKNSNQSNYEIEHWKNSWMLAGGGLRFSRYDQDINSSTSAANEINRLYHATNGDVTFNASGGYFFKPQIGIEGQFIGSSGSFLEVTDKILIGYNWFEFNLEGIYLFNKDGFKTKKDHWFARAGVQYQTLSLLATFPAPSPVYEVIDTSHSFLTFGGGYSKLLSPSFKFVAHANLLFQVLASSSKFSYSTEFGYGLNTQSRLEYLLSEDFRVGFDWQFQYIDISYSLSNESFDIDGRQNLVQNKIGAYLSYEF